MSNLLRLFFRLWFLGFIFFLAILGYILYSGVWVIRIMQSRKKEIYILLLIVFLLIISGIYYLFFPTGSVHQEVEITIPRNANIRLIADSLKQKHVIKSKNALLIWMKITHLERNVQAGKVKFTTGDGVLRASRKLLKAYSIEYSITIQEGLTIEQTARKISSVFKHIDTSDIINLCKDSSFIAKLKIDAFTLEGYLYPNTYRFPDNVNAKEIVMKMVSSFEKAYKTLVPNKNITKKFTKNEIVTIASIIEKEAAISSERERISAVFHNRIRLGYPLGADPTVRYALRKFDGPLTVSDLNISSPYNTRKYTGLPPGPICSPGRGALQAAVSPAETKELYFVAKWDGSGAHDFSLTNEEHNRKKMLIRQQNEQRKKLKNKPIAKKEAK